MKLVVRKLTNFCITNKYHGTKYLYHGIESNLNLFLVQQIKKIDFFGTETIGAAPADQQQWTQVSTYMWHVYDRMILSPRIILS